MKNILEEDVMHILETESPYDFLKEKLGRKPSESETKLLEYLLIDKQLIPSGVNLLVDYILKTHDNQLDIELTKKFASCFKNSSLINTNETLKNNIGNVEELISMFEKEFQRNLTPTEIETVKELLETYTYEEISYALKTSAINGVFNLRYIIKVLETKIRKDINKLCKNYTFENFKINDYNKFAYKVSLATAKSSGNLYNPLFISANNKDKEHLLNAIGNYTVERFGYNVIYLSAKQYTETMTLKEIKNKYEDIDVLIIDDIEYLAKNFEEQSQLLLWCDKLHLKNKQIIFGSNIQKDKLSDFNENLRSMFNWGMSVDIVHSNSELTDENNAEQFNYDWLAEK